MSKFGQVGRWIFVGFLCLFLAAGMVACVYGYDSGDVVLSRTPAAVQQPVYTTAIDDETGESVRIRISEGVPEVLSYNKSKKHFEIWKEQQLRTGELWVANLEESAKNKGMLDAFTDLGINIVDNQLAGMGLVGMGGVGLLGTFLFKRPKDSTPEQVEAKIAMETARWKDVLSGEKRDSYNKGYQVGQESQQILINILKQNGIDIPNLPNRSA